MTPLFKIRFTGRLLPDVDKSHVILAFSRRFSMPPDKVRQLLAKGEGVTLKKGLDQQKAERYRKAVEELGMEVALLPMVSPPAAPGMTLEALDEKPEAPIVDRATPESNNGFAEKLQQATGQLSLEPIGEPVEESMDQSTETSGVTGSATACPKLWV